MINSNNYTWEQIDRTLRGLDGSRKVTFRYDLLSRMDVKIAELNGIISARINHGEFKTIKRSANFVHNTGMGDKINFLTDRIQPWFILHIPNGGTVEWPLGIFLLESPAEEVNGAAKRRNIGAYDKTLILDQYSFPHRLFFAKDTNYVAAIEQILNMSGIYNTNIAGNDLTFQNDKEFPLGTKAREAVNELLNAINYTSISFDGMGYAQAEPYIPPAQRTATIHYSADKDSIIAPGFVNTLDIATRANVFVRMAENLEMETSLSSVFVNDDPQSAISTVNRGRQITDFAIIENIANQDALDSLVHRIAIESTSAYRHLEFKTLLMPTHSSADTLYLDIPDVLDGPSKFNETDWDMDLRNKGLMSHKARVVVDL